MKIWLTLTSRPLYGLLIILLGLITFFFVDSIIGIVIIIIGTIIRIKQIERMGPDKYNLRGAKIDDKFIKSCRVCKYADIKPNFWSKNYPTCQCTMMGNKFNYMPDIVPRWCPYAIK
jgi:hypothetical protein